MQLRREHVGHRHLRTVPGPLFVTVIVYGTCCAACWSCRCLVTEGRQWSEGPSSVRRGERVTGIRVGAEMRHRCAVHDGAVASNATMVPRESVRTLRPAARRSCRDLPFVRPRVSCTPAGRRRDVVKRSCGGSTFVMVTPFSVVRAVVDRDDLIDTGSPWRRRSPASRSDDRAAASGSAGVVHEVMVAVVVARGRRRWHSAARTRTFGGSNRSSATMGMSTVSALRRRHSNEEQLAAAGNHQGSKRYRRSSPLRT